MSRRNASLDRLIFPALFFFALVCGGILFSCQNPLQDVLNRTKRYRLAIQTSGDGCAACAPSTETFLHGTVVTLAATPGALQYFGGWSGQNGAEVYQEGTEWQLLMDGDKTVTATFTSHATRRLFTSTAGASGTVTLSPPGWVYYDGTEVTITPNATVEQNAYFNKWSGANASDIVTTADGKRMIVMNADKSIIANFGTYGLGQVRIEGGGEHSLFLDASGALWSWGRNSDGQLGNKTQTDSHRPVAVLGKGGTGILQGVIAVSAGSSHSLALLSDGTALGWGSNSPGKLGDGTTDRRTTPVDAIGLTDVVDVEAGNGHSLFLRSDKTAYACGWNSSGQLGDNSTSDRSTPIQVVKSTTAGDYLTDVASISAAQFHSVALLPDGTVLVWGDNGDSRLGCSVVGNRPYPVTVLGLGGIGSLTGIVAVQGGDRHTFALKADKTVVAWGYNASGQLGDGSYTNRTYPVAVAGLSDIIAVAAGYDHSLALKSDGTVWAWGLNADGQLGIGNTANQPTPVQVKDKEGTGKLTNVVAIAAGNNHSLALLKDGTVWAWGRNTYGQLGDGTTTSRSTPVQVQF